MGGNSRFKSQIVNSPCGSSSSWNHRDPKRPLKQKILIDTSFLSILRHNWRISRGRKLTIPEPVVLHRLRFLRIDNRHLYFFSFSCSKDNHQRCAMLSCMVREKYQNKNEKRDSRHEVARFWQLE